MGPTAPRAWPSACSTSLARPLPVAGRELQLSASLGIALGDSRYARADELLRDADTALYRAKELGRKRYELFDDTLAKNVVDELSMEGELRQALQRGEFVPYLQPIYRLDYRRAGRPRGADALEPPVSRRTAAGAFLKVAQDSGQIEAIDWQLFERACIELLRLPLPDAASSPSTCRPCTCSHADFDTAADGDAGAHRAGAVAGDRGGDRGLAAG